MKDQDKQVRWIAVLAAIAIGLYLCWLMLRPFISVLEWDVVLAIIFFPVHETFKHDPVDASKNQTIMRRSSERNRPSLRSACPRPSSEC